MFRNTTCCSVLSLEKLRKTYFLRHPVSQKGLPELPDSNMVQEKYKIKMKINLHTCAKH